MAEVRSYSYRGGDIAYLYDSELNADVISADLPGTDAGHWAQYASDVTLPLGYFYYIRGFKETHAEYHSSTDDRIAVDLATADWLFMDDLDNL